MLSTDGVGYAMPTSGSLDTYGSCSLLELDRCGQACMHANVAPHALQQATAWLPCHAWQSSKSPYVLPCS